MAESPSSPSSKALLSLISSSCPSPIPCSEYPVCKDNYLSYVLVKGSMGEPRCSKAEQRKSCIEDKKTGIGMDKEVMAPLSTSIPSFEPSVAAIEDGLRSNTQSLPSSPSKCCGSRSIKEIGAELKKLKEMDTLHILMAYQQLGTSIAAEDNQFIGSNSEAIISPEYPFHAIRQGESSSPKLKSIISAMNHPSPKAPGRPLLSYHGEADGPSKHSTKPLHPIHNILSSGKHNFTPNTWETFRSNPSQDIPKRLTESHLKKQDESSSL